MAGHVVLRSHGGIEQVHHLDSDWEGPEQGEPVHMGAWALNHLDLWVLGGLPGLELGFPHVPGADGAGTTKAGRAVVVYPGRGCGHCGACGSGDYSLCAEFRVLGEHLPGTFRSRISCQEKFLFSAPPHLTLEEASALPVAFLTAWSLLIGGGGLNSAKTHNETTVLITGIGGGVSLASLLLTKALGCKVYASSRHPNKREKALALGCEAAFESDPESLHRHVRKATGGEGVDLVVDSVAGPLYSACLKSLRRGGRLLTCGATGGDAPKAEVPRIFWNSLSTVGVTLGGLKAMASMLAFISKHGLRPVVDSRFPFKEVRQAYQRLQSGEAFGKVLLVS